MGIPERNPPGLPSRIPERDSIEGGDWGGGDWGGGGLGLGGEGG